jgi:hypothetical protein
MIRAASPSKLWRCFGSTDGVTCMAILSARILARIFCQGQGAAASARHIHTSTSHQGKLCRPPIGLFWQSPVIWMAATARSELIVGRHSFHITNSMQTEAARDHKNDPEHFSSVLSSSHRIYAM